MPTKVFRLSADQVKPLAEGHGGFFASDHILVDGMPVGFMYREEPENTLDSGWRFMSGLEEDDYANDPDRLGFYDVNTVANYYAYIVPLLHEPVGSAFEKIPGSASFQRAEGWAPEVE
jgi:hypothetical protein